MFTVTLLTAESNIFDLRNIFLLRVTKAYNPHVFFGKFQGELILSNNYLQNLTTLLHAQWRSRPKKKSTVQNCTLVPCRCCCFFIELEARGPQKAVI